MQFSWYMKLDWFTNNRLIKEVKIEEINSISCKPLNVVNVFMPGACKSIFTLLCLNNSLSNSIVFCRTVHPERFVIYFFFTTRCTVRIKSIRTPLPAAKKLFVWSQMASRRLRLKTVAFLHYAVAHSQNWKMKIWPNSAKRRKTKRKSMFPWRQSICTPSYLVSNTTQSARSAQGIPGRRGLVVTLAHCLPSWVAGES